MDSPKPRSSSPWRYILIILALVGSNFLTMYVFSWHPQGPAVLATLTGSDRALVSPFVHSLMLQLNRTQAQLERTERALMDVRADLKACSEMGNRCLGALSSNMELLNASSYQSIAASKQDADADDKDPWMKWSRQMREQGMKKEMMEYIAVRKLPLGWSGAITSDSLVSPVGHPCAREEADLKKYMDYKVGERCPDDSALAHRLTVHGCEPLPRRRCFATIPPLFAEPYPTPKSLWATPDDRSILWTAYTCKSFACLNDRKNHKVFEDCLDCFELDGREKGRWVRRGNELEFSIDEVLEEKNGSIRIGLDIGGGTGSFAVRMKEHDVTIVTTTLNLNGPFNNFIALRGVVPLFITIAQRLPFFDNTLDIVHSMHVLSNWIPTESLEFLLFDIDRVLRPGGLFWVDRFFCLQHQLNQTFVPLIEKLRYRKIKWRIGPKLDRGPNIHEMYLSALLEKPITPSSSP